MAAVDNGVPQTATTTLTILVEDENDNNPKFRKPFYKTSITENSKNGAHIETVIADDADKNRTMTYSLEGNPNILKSNLLYININFTIYILYQFTLHLWFFFVTATLRREHSMNLHFNAIFSYKKPLYCFTIKKSLLFQQNLEIVIKVFKTIYQKQS